MICVQAHVIQWFKSCLGVTSGPAEATCVHLQVDMLFVSIFNHSNAACKHA
jgi:hypothetical protein